jgi:hypothetical protein
MWARTAPIVVVICFQEWGVLTVMYLAQDVSKNAFIDMNEVVQTDPGRIVG